MIFLIQKTTFTCLELLLLALFHDSWKIERRYIWENMRHQRFSFDRNDILVVFTERPQTQVFDVNLIINLPVLTDKWKMKLF